MGEKRYLISDASKKLNIEPHVLRYWEEELELAIHRNEMGHRYYTELDLEALKGIQTLKNQGFQLKAIKSLVPSFYSGRPFDLNKMLTLKDELNAQVEEENQELVKEDSITLASKKQKSTLPQAQTNRQEVLSNEHKLAQFQDIINRAVAKALVDNQGTLSDTVGTKVSETVSNRVTDQILKQMDYLMRENEDHAEARYKKLDETIREVQRARMEAAAAEEPEKEKRGFFRMNKQKKEKKTKKNGASQNN